MSGLQTGGFELSAIPQAPVWPSNIGHFDPMQAMGNMNAGLDLTNKMLLNPLTMQANTSGLQAQITGNQLDQSAKARELAFAKAQEANQLQDAADYAKMQHDQFARIGASGNPAAFTPYAALIGSGGPPPMGVTTDAAPSTPQASVQTAPQPIAPAQGPLSPAPSASVTATSGQSNVLSSVGPSAPPAGAPVAASGGGSGPLSSIPPTDLGGSMGGMMNSPMMGGLMTLPGANGQLSVQPIAPNPMLGRYTQGIHTIQVGSDPKTGLPMLQNVSEGPLGPKLIGRPFTTIPNQGDGGQQAAPTESGGSSQANPNALPAADQVQIQKTYGTEESPAMRAARLQTPEHQKLMGEVSEDTLAFNKAQQNLNILTKAVYANNGLMPDPSGKLDANGNPAMVPDPNAHPIASGPLAGKMNLNALSGSGAGLAIRGMLGDSSGADLASARSSLVGDVMSNVHNIRNINEYKGVTAVLPEPTQPPQAQLQNVWNAQKKLNNLVQQNAVRTTALSAGMADGDAWDYSTKKTAGQWAASSGNAQGSPVNDTAPQPNTASTGSQNNNFVVGSTYQDAKGKKATWDGQKWNSVE